MNKKVIGTSSVIAGILASVIAIEGGYVNFASRKNYSFFSAYVTKGTLIEYSNFHAYGLKKGGGLELALIILSHPKANQRRRAYVIK